MPNSSDFNRYSFAPTDLDIRRSMFDIRHTSKFSCNVGEVIPFEVIQNVMPGDTFNIETTKVIRLQPLVAPIFDEVILDVYWFFVPYRLCWNHFVNFMGENTETAWTPTTEYTIPQITIPSGGFDVGTIADYMGIPPKQGAGTTISALPFRAYARIMSEWFRREAIEDPVHVHLDDETRTGVNSGDQVTDIELGGKPFIAAKFHDYFTSALPEPQYGDAVTFNLFNNLDFAYVYSSDHDQFVGGDKVPKMPNGDIPQPLRGAFGKYMYESTDIGTEKFAHNAGTKSQYNLSLTYTPDAGGPYSETVAYRGGTYSTADSGSVYFYPSNLTADLYEAFDRAGATFNINDLRIAFAVQRYMERQARSGSRYIEYIKAFYNVDSPDARLQRSEYLGGSRIPLNINSIEQTSATVNGQTPQGNPVGLSVTGDMNSDFIKSFTEHGCIIGVAVARYHHSYQNGINKSWTRKTPYDFYNPVFANLGEMPIRNDEIYLGTDEDVNKAVFAYQEAWADYRSFENRVSGELRSSATIPLDMWHLCDNYSQLPYYSAEWIREDKTPLDRCLAVTSAVSNQIICDFLIDGTATRPMPTYSIPGLIDHH